MSRANRRTQSSVRHPARPTTTVEQHQDEGVREPGDRGPVYPTNSDEDIQDIPPGQSQDAAVGSSATGRTGAAGASARAPSRRIPMDDYAPGSRVGRRREPQLPSARTASRADRALIKGTSIVINVRDEAKTAVEEILRNEGSVDQIVSSVIYKDGHVRSDFELSAAIAGAYDVLKGESAEVQEKVALGIVKTRLQQSRWSKYRAKPFFWNFSLAGGIGAASKYMFGCIRYNMGDLSVGSAAFRASAFIVRFAPVFWLPPILCRAVAAFKLLVQGAPGEEQLERIRELTTRTMRFATDEQSARIMSASLVVGIQGSVANLDKAWLKNLVIQSTPEVYRQAVRSAVAEVTPSTLTSMLNIWLGTNFGGGSRSFGAGGRSR